MSTQSDSTSMPLPEGSSSEPKVKLSRDEKRQQRLQRQSEQKQKKMEEADQTVAKPALESDSHAERQGKDTEGESKKGQITGEPASQVKGKVQVKRNSKDGITGKGKSKGRSSETSGGPARSGPYFDGRNPCTYYLAGYCYYGDKCTAGVHDYDYGVRLQQQWLNPISEDICPPAEDTRKANTNDYIKSGMLATQRLLGALLEGTRISNVGTNARLDNLRQILPAFQQYFELGEDSLQRRDVLTELSRFISFRRSLHSDVKAKLAKTSASTKAAENESDSDELLAMSCPALNITEPDITASSAAAADPGKAKRWGGKSKASFVSLSSSQAAPLSSVTPTFKTSPEFLLILDLEGKDEITEFPVLVLRHGTEVGRFHRYVRPKHLFPKDVYKKLDAPPKPGETPCPSILFEFVLRDFRIWLNSKFEIDLNRANPQQYCFVTCGDWDMKQIYNQCRISCSARSGADDMSPEAARANPSASELLKAGKGVGVYDGFLKFINIKKIMGRIKQKDMTKSGMKGMLAHYQWLEDGECKWGFHHSGAHDVENITMVMLRLLESSGGEVEITSEWDRGRMF